MSWVVVVLFVLGLALIIKCGDWFIDAACWTAEVTGVPKILIGATIVSVATTLPELFVSLIAVSSGATDLGIGNSIGSVICNTGLILAISLLYAPKLTDRRIFYTRGFIMVLSLVLLFFFSMDSLLTWPEGLGLMALFFIYIYTNVRNIRGQLGQPMASNSKHREKIPGKIIFTNIAKFVFGAAGIILGAHLLVDNGVIMAQSLGVPQGVIGVTIIALGTSLPELVTTIASLVKKQPSLGIGNIIGANILNMTLILSACTFISHGGLELAPQYLPMLNIITSRPVYIDMPLCLALFTILFVPTFFGGKLKRWQGGLMLSLYAAFIVFLVLNV